MCGWCRALGETGTLKVSEAGPQGFLHCWNVDGGLRMEWSLSCVGAAEGPVDEARDVYFNPH